MGRRDLHRQVPLKEFGKEVLDPPRCSSFLYRLVRSGQLAHYREGSRILLTLADYHDYSRREARSPDCT